MSLVNRTRRMRRNAAGLARLALTTALIPAVGLSGFCVPAHAEHDHAGSANAVHDVRNLENGSVRRVTTTLDGHQRDLDDSYSRLRTESRLPLGSHRSSFAAPGACCHDGLRVAAVLTKDSKPTRDDVESAAPTASPAYRSGDASPGALGAYGGDPTPTSSPGPLSTPLLC